jgi:hypothetical protein
MLVLVANSYQLDHQPAEAAPLQVSQQRAALLAAALQGSGGGGGGGGVLVWSFSPEPPHLAAVDQLFYVLGSEALVLLVAVH